MLPIAEISIITGINKDTLYRRYKRAKGRTGEKLDLYIAMKPYEIWLEKSRKEMTEEEEYTEEELYEIFLMFAGTVDAEEELERLSGFMGKSVADLEARAMLKLFRKRYMEEHIG